MRVGVYGSLKRGGGLNHAMQSATFLGEDTFKGQLYSLGHVPAALAGGEEDVHCEVFECSDELIARLDRIEGHPWMYMRTKVPTSSHGEVEVYIYQRRPHERNRIASGIYDVKDWNRGLE